MSYYIPNWCISIYIYIYIYIIDKYTMHLSHISINYNCCSYIQLILNVILHSQLMYFSIHAVHLKAPIYQSLIPDSALAWATLRELDKNETCCHKRAQHRNESLAHWRGKQIIPCKCRINIKSNKYTKSSYCIMAQIRRNVIELEKRGWHIYITNWHITRGTGCILWR